MEPVIPALHALRCGVGDVLPAFRPPHLVALALHQGDKLFPGGGVLHTQVDRTGQLNLPALPFVGGAILPTAHPLLFHLLLRRRQNFQAVGKADLIAGQPVGLQVSGALVEFLAVLERDAVHHQVIVQMAGVDVSGHQHLEIGELPLGQLQSDSVDLLGRQVICLRKGLDEVVVLPPVRFPIPPLGELHFGEGGLGGAVPASHQPLSFPQCLFFLLDVSQHTAQSTLAATTIFDCGECGHYVTSRRSWRSCSLTCA